MHRIAPIFPVRDLELAMDHYRRLGFAVRRYPPGGYGFVSRDSVEIHLGVVSDPDRRTSSAYLFVDDSDELAAQWRAAGGAVPRPQGTPRGGHAGAAGDPAGKRSRV